MAREQLRVERRLEKKFAAKAKAIARKTGATSGNLRKSNDLGELSGQSGVRDEKKRRTKVAAPLEAIRDTVGGLFGGLSTLATNVASKGITVVDNYWKGRGISATPQPPRLKSAGEKKVNSAGSTPAESVALSHAESVENGDAGSDDEDDVASEVSSSDSDVQEIEAPLVPPWLNLQNARTKVSQKITSLLAKHGLEQRTEQLRVQASELTSALATRGLESAEWILEKTGESVSVLSAALYQKLNGLVAKLITDLGAPTEDSERTLPRQLKDGAESIAVSLPDERTPADAEAISPPPRPKGIPPSFRGTEGAEVAAEEIKVEMA